MGKVLEGTSIQLSEKEFHCRGEFGPFHKGRPNNQDLEQFKNSNEDIINNKEERVWLLNII